jgi:hypothetical protein
MATPEPSSAPAAPTEQGAARRVRSPPAEDSAHVQAGLAEAAAGKGVETTLEELTGWESTGELPATVEARWRHAARP